jgi:sodium/potassium-transporting ATPase subunit alpha
LYVYFQSFAYYGITAADINNNKNTYFIEKGTAPDFTTSTGEVYDNEEQDFILGVVQAGYYLMIVCGQAVHVFVCRTAIISVFEHGIFTNMTTNLGVCIAILLGCMVVYIPVLQKIDGAGDAIPETLAVGTTMAFVLIWGWTEGRKWFSRNYPRHWLNGYLQW